jgi:hypothetical protein
MAGFAFGMPYLSGWLYAILFKLKSAIVLKILIPDVIARIV